jgi:arsenical pump membrane protein
LAGSHSVVGFVGRGRRLADGGAAARSAIAALLVAAVCLFRAPHLLSLRLVPWRLLTAVTVLFVAVQVAHDYGLGDALGTVAGKVGDRFAPTLQLAGVSAVGANLADNLPAYLAMEPVADGSPLRMAALLIGVNTGPLITPWASLATLLWADRCRAAGVPVRWRTFAVRGLMVVPILLISCATALALAS